MTSCSRSLAASALAAILASSAFAADPAAEPSIAVLAPLDLAGTEVPSDEIAAALAAALEAEGFRVLPVERDDALLERHRLRYTGGASAEMAVAFGAEEAIEGILLTSVDDWEENEPPRLTLTCRWVGASPEAPILWMGGAYHHGAVHPGALVYQSAHPSFLRLLQPPPADLRRKAQAVPVFRDRGRCEICVASGGFRRRRGGAPEAFRREKAVEAFDAHEGSCFDHLKPLLKIGG